MSINSYVTPSPLGPLTLFAEKGHIIALDWGKGIIIDGPDKDLLQDAAKQLKEYFSSDLKNFDLPINPHGTKFQKKVWSELLKIPYGKTKSYSDIANLIESGPRAVGNACGVNPIPIIIPCHRIITNKGDLGGYSGGNGQETKIKLIEHEKNIQ